MHEGESDTAEIDVIAADINWEAARVVALTEAHARSASQRKSFAEAASKLLDGDEGPAEEVIARAEREEAIARDMAVEAEKVRESAAELQRLARAMREQTTEAPAYDTVVA